MSEIIKQITENEKDMLRFLKEAPIVIPENNPIAGFDLFDPQKITPPFLPRDMDKGDNLHFSMGITFLTYGFKGVAQKARKALATAENAERKASLTAIASVYDAVCEFILRHAQAVENKLADCEENEKERLEKLLAVLKKIAEDKPETLYEAVQCYYFAWKLRGVLNTSTMGRLDQYLYPFYKHDIEAGIITEQEAFELICALCERANDSGSGDTLMNVMLGGQTAEGKDLSNDLSVIMTRASIKVAKAEPHLNYRYHKGMREDLLEALSQLQAMGMGQATLYNDEVIIPALIKAGIPKEYAYDYTNDGCTEITIDQKSTIFFDKFDTVKCMELALFNGEPPELPGKAMVGYWNRYVPAGEWQTTLELGYKSGDAENAESFEEVFECCKRQMVYQLNQIGGRLIDNYRRMQSESVAPAFLNGSFEETLSSGEDCHRKGLPVECLTMFSGSIPTVADCLAAIKTVVFERKSYSMKELLSALRANFEGYEVMRRELLNAPKFGNDHDLPDSIAAELAELFCDTMHELGRSRGIIIWPALLGYLFVQEAFFTGATPDGRKWKDPIAEHYSATPGKATKGPTALICSVGKANLAKAFGTAPIHITLTRSIVPNDKNGAKLMRTIADAAVEKNFVALNLAVYDVERLKQAQLDPENNADIIVRVWGYSARFIDLSDEMQEHIIRRTGGCE